ncbi:CDP-diacylglycerol pyrophosphatase [Polynucleobacter meluiroseus]|uniref:CDP-diacylglycerol pyrophosphatase n=1 Tax=Polynucleobacter meluiroseus TaxID=1938814 RepID=A0A240DXI8_9BURK|nr:CDP-diacylglycerol diphosphatase [Polynucleobacter meluiroseus]SNX27908.1 CDP-diacylglycerol pyrophosphatase [Polynucleobacter meluiroseus]
MRKQIRQLFLSCILVAGVCGATHSVIAGTVAKSDILLHIVTQCVEPAKESYCNNCMMPRLDANCGSEASCKKTTEVWAQNDKYTVIRDIKMCGCPAEFVHGLAMPRNVVTGVEDANRPEAIWQFAWDSAIEKIDVESLALVVNPRGQRSQNQLHIHLLRLNAGARERFDQYSGVYVQNLEHVWAEAAKSAKAKGLNDYGVLVARVPGNQYLVIAIADSPEALLTKWSCN